MNAFIRMTLLSFTAMFVSILSTQATVSSSCADRSHRKEAAMSNSGGKISAPISIESDVYKVIGIAAQGRYDIGYACSNAHGKTNKWAKYKPTKYQSISTTTDTWKATDGLCGLSIPIYTAIGSTTSGLIKDIIDGANWPYNPPTGGSGQPFRITDFNGYNHNAICPFGSDIPSDLYLDRNNTLSFQLENLVQDITDDSNLKISDFTFNGVKATDMYVGLLLSSGSYIVGTSSEKLKDTVEISLVNMQNYTGTWKAGVFLSSVKFSNIDSNPAGIYVPIPIQMQQVKIHAYGTLYSVQATGIWNKSNSAITYRYGVINNGGEAQQVSGIMVSLYRKTYSQSFDNGSLVAVLKSGLSHTVSANGQYVSEDFTYAVQRNDAYEYYLAASATGSAVTYMPVEDDNSMID